MMLPAPNMGSAQALLPLDLRSANERLDLMQKKKKATEGNRLPNMPSPYAGAAADLLNSAGNQY